MNARLSNALDCIRWIAALLVLLTHLNNRMFVRIVELPAGERPPLLYLWSFICGFAHHAVVTFFVLSGFLVGGKLLRDRGRFTEAYLKDYAVARVARIYLVLLPVLVLTAVLDSAGAGVDHDSRIYTGEMVRSLGSFWSIVGTLLNVQTIFTPIFGSNGALWSLANEFWFYVIAPMLLLPWSGVNKEKARITAALGLVILVAFSLGSKDFAAGFVLWCIGAFAAQAPRFVAPRPVLAIAGYVGALLLFRAMMRSQHMDQFHLRVASDLVVAASLAYLLYSLRFAASTGQAKTKVLNERLAGFSYSLYALHTPVIMLVCTLLEYRTGFGWKEAPTSLVAVLCGLSAIAVALAASYALSRITEARTDTVRRAIASRIKPAPRNSAAA